MIYERQSRVHRAEVTEKFPDIYSLFDTPYIVVHPLMSWEYI
jgi:hypothetical protein